MSSEQEKKPECSGWQIPPEGSPCWIEIPAVDIVALKAFYAGVFPAWNWKDVPTDKYDPTEVQMYEFPEPKGLGGGILKVDPAVKAQKQTNGVGHTVSYFVQSIEKTEAKVKELGGEVVLGKTDEHGNGWYAKFRDPEGNIFGIYELKKQQQ